MKLKLTYFHINVKRFTVFSRQLQNFFNPFARLYLAPFFARNLCDARVIKKKNMFLEVEDETRDFITIYKKDFPSKETERRRECRQQPVYPPPLNILNGPYRKVLNTRRQNLMLPLSEQSEDPEESLKRFHEKYPRLKKSFPEVVPNEDLVEEKENEVTQTVYHVDYSKGDYSPRVQIYGRWKDIELPDHWVISETIQKKSYRNPWKIATESLLRVRRFEKPPDNLVPSKREREILRVRTGDSEYGAIIGAVGHKIMKKRLHGAPLSVFPQIYTKSPDSPPSECSRILAEKKLALPSNVL